MHNRRINIHINDVDKYIANIPEQARSHFDELRKLLVKQLPDAHEVLSYGVIGYKPDPKKRAVVFISGWRDHAAIYPVPRSPELATELQPYIKGKGTLWFKLDESLPIDTVTAEHLVFLESMASRHRDRYR